MKILADFKHLVRHHLKHKGPFGNNDNQKIKYIIPALTAPEIRNISQTEKQN